MNGSQILEPKFDELMPDYIKSDKWKSEKNIKKLLTKSTAFCIVRLKPVLEAEFLKRETEL